MTIKEIKSATLYKEYSLQIPYDEINKIIDSKINELLPTVSLPGFRKGKAPINIVRKKYENNVLNEAIENLVQIKTKDLLDKENLKPFTQPKVDLKKYEKNQPIEVEIKIDLEPEIKLNEFKNLNVNKYEINLGKSDIDKNYKDFLKAKKKYSSIKENRKINKNDKVIINLSSDDEIVPKFLKSQKNLPLILDSDFEILPNIGSRLIEKNISKGEKTKLKLDISKSIKAEKETLAEFDIELIDIQESVKFAVDKEFLEKNGLKNEEELKNNLESSYKSQYDNALNQIQKKELMDALDKKHSFDLPQGILDQEFHDIWHRLEHAKKDGKLDEDDKKLNDDDLKLRYQDISKRRVKLAILLQYIAKENKISVDEKELTNGMIQYSSQYPGQEKQILEYFKNNPSSIETIRGPILEQKVIDFITSEAKVNNKKINLSEFEKLEKKTFDLKKAKK